MNNDQPGSTVTPSNKLNAPAPTKKTSATSSENTTPWHFQSEDEAQNLSSDQATIEKSDFKPIIWSASEFIEHSKSVGWYLLLMLGTAILAGLCYLLTHDKITTAVIIVAAVFFGFYANRKPRTLEYRIENSGLGIGNKTYSFGQFKSFAVMDEEAFSSIVLLPLKRFSPLVSIYYDPKDERQIMQALSGRLPLDERRLDPVDRLLKKIRY